MESFPNRLMLVIMFLAHSVCLAFHFQYTESTSNHSVNPSCIDSEWKALMDIKGALIDTTDRLSSWTGKDCCSWDGITCDNVTGAVKMLDLSMSDLGGKIHPSILNLEHLEYLDLYYNNFSGTPIPPFLGSLKNLRYLDLDANFGGEVPPHLGNLSNLQQLYIGEPVYLLDTLLTIKSLKWISRLTSLETLEIYNTDMSQSLDWLSSINSLPSLSTLTLSGCGLVDLPPDSFCNLTSLISMDLSFNQFEGSIPLCIGNLSSLTSLYLESNKLGGELPDELGNLKQLTTLDLSVNYFEGPIPSSFGQLSMMKSLNLNANQLNGTIPPALLNLTELDTLDVTYNSLSGALSESDFGKLKSLRHFRISKNKFLSFNVSSRWIPPFQLDELVMDFVFIGTQFPPFLQTQRNISHIALRNASISGSLPGWCWTTSADLFYFDLSNNFLTGPVPAFGANHSINSRFGALNLANNHLTGNIPEELCNLQSLKVISLANNLLTGKIPLCLGEMRQLEVLDLANNSLSGQIPYTLGELGGLNFLHLSGNKLFGLLPSSLQNLTFLVTLDLANNQFRDSIPDWIGKEFSRLRFLRLQSNNFYGNISVNLCQLPSLQVLNLAENNLVGNIPPCLGNLSAMLSDESRGDTGIGNIYYDSLWNILKGSDQEYITNLRYVKSITLSGNNIYGEIPDELMDLQGLQNLNLSRNNLSGKIPERIDNLKSLESLDLSMNQLSGAIPQRLANIDSLSYLNLSFNNLAGRVPSGNHFNTLNDPSIYEENSGLCGKPLTKSCPDDSPSREGTPATSSHGTDHNADKFEFSWFYYGIGPGFAVGFFGVFYVLHLKKSWRHAYFRSVENVCDKVWVTFAVRISQFQRRVM